MCIHIKEWKKYFEEASKIDYEDGFIFDIKVFNFKIKLFNFNVEVFNFNINVFNFNNIEFNFNIRNLILNL